MKPIESGLETVLKVKHFQVKKSQKELMVLLTAKNAEQEALDGLHDRHESAMTGAFRTLRTKATALQTDRAFIRKLSLEITQQTEKVEEIQKKEDVKRDELLQKSQSEKIVENLDEKRKIEITRTIEKKEQRLIDILAARVRPEY